jgi:hypothetical protein
VSGGPSILLAAFALLAATAAVPPPAPVTPSPIPVRTIVGSIVAVHLARGEVVLAESVTKARQAKHRAETVTLRIDPSTQLVRGRSSVRLEALVPGDQAVARYAGPATGARAISLRVADPVLPPPAPTRPPS